MNHLFTYIEAIGSSDGKVCVIDREVTDNSYEDQGVTVRSVEARYSFSNGVILKHCIEFDEAPLLSDVCSECWISYEVIDSSAEKITPVIKTFVNQCQEDFWLKMQKLRVM